jgi:hypothetical protein
MQIRLLALLSVLATSAATEAANVSDLIFTELPTTVTITGCKSTASGSLDIPGTINGRAVTTIQSGAFQYRTQLTSITVPSSVTSIGQEAFYNCTGLASVTLPPNLTSIGYHTFSQCSSLATVTLPTSLTSIGQEAFYNCSSLADITLPPGLTSIGYHAFSECSSLTTIAVPSSVTSIAQYAFAQCSGLTTITLPPDLTTITNGLFNGCTALTAIELPAGLTTIESAAFQNCKALTTVSIPAGVTIIDYSTFADCSALTSISVPAGVTTISDLAFARCGNLAAITLPTSLTSLGKDAFLNCSSIPAITLPATTTSIGERAFSGCASLPTVTIPAGVTSIGKAAFARCTALGGIAVDPSNAHYAGSGGILFSKDGTILHQCGGGALTATIPPGVTSIAESAFHGCGKLITLTVPSSVEHIAIHAFDACPKLKTFLFLGNLPGMDGENFTWSATTTVYHLAGRYGWQFFEELPSAVVGLPAIAVGLSDLVTSPGGSASLHVGVDPAYPLPCQFKWQKNGIDIPGATQPTLALSGIQPGDAGTYTVLVSSEVGTVSDHATLSLSAGNLYTQSQYDAGVTLGYQLGRQAGIDEIMEEPNTFDLFSAAQIQTIHIGTPLLQRDASTGQFELKIAARKSTSLGAFSPLSFATGEVTLSPAGELLFRFSSPDNAAFFRVDAE